MADSTKLTPLEDGLRPTPSSQHPRPLSRHQQLNKLYALPAPLRTFPLPTFVPHNPLSLFHILYKWLSQTITPQPSHFEPKYQGWFSAETRSVHVTDERSVRGLWEQGFYGKGTLSRSEPSWLNREKTRRGTEAKITSEERTRVRRAERQQTKWERARKEREAIDQKLLEEAETAGINEVKMKDGDKFTPVAIAAEEPIIETPEVEQENGVMRTLKSHRSPIGPLELLSLPNSHVELLELSNQHITLPTTISCFAEDFDAQFVNRFYVPPIGPLELLALPNSLKTFVPQHLDSDNDQVAKLDLPSHVNGFAGSDRTPAAYPAANANCRATDLGVNGLTKTEAMELAGGSDTNEESIDQSTLSEDTDESGGTAPNGFVLVTGDRIPCSPQIKRQKSVRFSPTVEKNTFIQTEPPSPELAGSSTTVFEEQLLIVKNQEHTQLTLEEAFFLSYGLGVLEILDPRTKAPIPNIKLFALFRETSYFPPLARPTLSPDDPFMINYVVYHHFRSLGWVVRSGVKFSVDIMLYVRGPVFTHAEFGVLILPSYSDPYWSSDVFLQNYVKDKETRSWAWLSRINRVITQAKKTLILAYVDIPRPLGSREEEKLGVDEILCRYKIKEIVMKRWISNRSRD